MSAFLSYRSARPHSGALVYAILDIGRCRKFEEFLRFFGKTTPYGKIFKILFESFPCYTDRRCWVQISWNVADWKSAKSCVIYQTKNWPALQTVANALIAPKICQGLSPTMYSKCSRFHPNRFAFGWVIAERVNTAKLPSKLNPIFGRSIASSRIIILYHKPIASKLTYVYSNQVDVTAWYRRAPTPTE